MATFGEKLRELMKTNKMTQQELADKLNVERGSVSNWVTNRRFPDRSILLKLSSIFEVSIDYLIGADFESKEELESDEEKEIDEFVVLYEQLNEKNKDAIVTLMKNLLSS